MPRCSLKDVLLWREIFLDQMIYFGERNEFALEIQSGKPMILEASTFAFFFFFSCTFWLPNLESLLYLTHVYLVLVLNFISSLGRCKASTLVAIARTNDFYNFACDSVSIKSNR